MQVADIKTISDHKAGIILTKFSYLEKQRDHHS